ncbi:TonB-dependent receptor domain-containing protein [Parapedobacter sp. 2B3]|uniref:TonB-dependent receptor n=1 Tax=Parapedobacter sp. 2B3 TaxID=3342381 RepID=UPI0035B5A61A
MAILMAVYVHGQPGTLTGMVTDEQGNVLVGTSVTIGGAVSPQITDHAGRFAFANLPSGSYTLRVTHVGYAEYIETIRFDGRKTELTIRLSAQATILEGATVIGKTETQQIREQAIRAVVVDTRAVAEQPTTLAELMNRAPGIRIRQSGGLGNAVDVSVNGFQGNSVQYFRDGIPLEYLGGGYGINNVPLNLLERIEIYKGVIPVSLGGDALGGAVNLVTPKHTGTQFNASYEIASFNTHIGNLSFYHTDKENRIFLGIDAFYNYADNDYKADVEVVDENANLIPETVRLFHNGYKHHFGEGYFGLKNRTWADELKVSIAGYGMLRASQHPALMTNPYGAITLRNRGIVPSVRYRKAILENKLSFDQFVSYSMVTRNRTDTVRGTYDWYGEFTPRTTDDIGESPNPSLSDIDLSNVVSRTNIAYQVDNTNTIEANLVINYNQRIGSDPYGFRFAGTDIDILSRRAVYKKNIAGITWESKWLADKLTNQLSVKHFNFTSTGINAFLSNDTDLSKFTTATDHNWGVGNAIKYEINEHSILRASAELTNRLPNGDELFGNNDTRAPNFNLQPERSFNVNLGYRYASESYMVEVGTYYRKTKGMILLVPIQSPFSQYQNLDSIAGYGFDIDMTYRPTKFLTINANTTWQDNRMVDVGSTLYKWIEGTRLRNTPYFFANVGLTGHYSNVFTNHDLLKPYVNFNFIREFYLNYIPRDKEPQGFLGIFGKSAVPIKDLVPDQSLISVGVNYLLPVNNVSFGAEIKNLADAKLYDYYKVQRPGRSFHIKVNYYIKSIKG